jgi:hypothetical protein
VKEAGWNQKHHDLEADQARLWILEKFHLGLGQDARSFAGGFLSWTSGTSTCATRRQSPTPTWKLRSRTAAAQGPCMPQVAPGKSHRGPRNANGVEVVLEFDDVWCVNLKDKTNQSLIYLMFSIEKIPPSSPRGRSDVQHFIQRLRWRMGLAQRPGCPAEWTASRRRCWVRLIFLGSPLRPWKSSICLGSLSKSKAKDGEWFGNVG